MDYQSQNKKFMMTNNNPHQNRYNPISSSSIFSQQSSPEYKRNTNNFENAGYLDPFPKRDNKPISTFNTGTSSRDFAHQSMISTNESTVGKRKGFGLLDGMARKVTTNFQQNTLSQAKSQIQPSNGMNTAQSMLVNNHVPFESKYGFKKEQGMIKNTNRQQNGVEKKRRQSFDISSLKHKLPSQIMPFLRKGASDLLEAKNHAINNLGPTSKFNYQASNSDSYNPLQNDNFQGLRQKNFQFLKKRKDLLPSQSGSSLNLQSVQSLKNLPSYSAISNPFKKPEFLSPNQKIPVNEVKCPEDTESPSRSDFLKNKASNYEFKKKKFGQGMSQYPGSPKSLLPKEIPEQKEMMTMKDRRQSKPQRQIKLSDFQLLQKLGKGAFGDVYIAQQKHIGFVCVIKKMSKKRIRQMKVEEHILREIKIQLYLNHNNVTQLFGYFHDEQHLYLIIEALPDGSLQQVKKKKKLSQKETAAIIKQVSEGLKYMHEESIIHRDLKPQNLFVNEGVIKLGDFGCSIFNNTAGLRNTIVGCLEYSSPEQLSKEGYSEKIDSWSLGILTYELLFGKSPFEKDIIELTKNKEKKADLSNLVFPSGILIKQQTKNFIENLLSQNPDKRMDMDEVLHHAFLKQQMSKKGQKFQFI